MHCIRTPENPDLAWEFAKYMQSDKGQTLLAGLGLITVINHKITSSDAVNKAPGMPEHNIYRVTSPDYATNGYAFLTNWEEMVSKAIQPYYDQILANTMTPADAVKGMQADLEKLFAESAKQQ